MSAVEGFDLGLFTSVVTKILDPTPIYQAIAGLSVFGTVCIVLFPLFTAIRFSSESLKLGDGKSGFELIKEALSNYINYLLYLLLGFMVIMLILGVRWLTEDAGSNALLESSLSDFRGNMLDKNQEEDWIATTLRAVSDVGGIFIAPIAYIAYQLSFVFYVVTKQAIQVFFAIGLAYCYLLGFLALIAESLPEDFRIMKGWKNLIVFLVLWGILHNVTMFLVYVCQLPAQKVLVGIYGGGLGTTALIMWSFAVTIIFAFASIASIMVIFFAQRIASGQGGGDVLGGGIAAISTVATKVIKEMSQGGGTMGKGMAGSVMPSMDGDRTRDEALRGIGDKADNVFKSDILGGAKSYVQGLSGNDQKDTPDFLDDNKGENDTDK